MEGKQNEQSSTETKSGVGDDEILKNGISDGNIKSNKSNADDSEVKNVDIGLPATEDELYLKDMFLGFDDEANLKDPFTGFSDALTDMVIPYADNKSLILMGIRKEIEGKQITADVDSIISYNKPIMVPKSTYLMSGGGVIHMEIVNKEMNLFKMTSQEVDHILQNDGHEKGRIWHRVRNCHSDKLYPKKLNPSQKPETIKLEISADDETGASKCTFVQNRNQLPKRYSTGEYVVYPEKVPKMSTKKPRKRKPAKNGSTLCGYPLSYFEGMD